MILLLSTLNIIECHFLKILPFWRLGCYLLRDIAPLKYHLLLKILPSWFFLIGLLSSSSWYCSSQHGIYLSVISCWKFFHFEAESLSCDPRKYTHNSLTIPCNETNILFLVISNLDSVEIRSQYLLHCHPTLKDSICPIQILRKYNLDSAEMKSRFCGDSI